MNARQFGIDKNVFSRDVILRTSLWFTDKYHVSIEVAEAAQWTLTLTAKAEGATPALSAVEGEFRNALINEAFRDALIEKTRTVKELLVAKALFGAEQEPDGLPDTEVPGAETGFSDKETDDFLADPLGIAIPWEERYGQAADDSPSAPAASPEPVRAQETAPMATHADSGGGRAGEGPRHA